VRAFPLRPDLQSATSSSYDPDGFLQVGVDGDSATTNLPPLEALHPLGFIARPMDPGTDGAGNVNQGQACTVIRLTGDNTDDAIVLSDPRATGQLPQLPLGSAMLYEPSGAADPARVLASGADHTLTIHVTTGAKVTIEVAGGPSLLIDGTAVQLGAPGGQFVVVNPAALTASFAALQTALAGIGVTWTPPTGIAATKAMAT
jgi:hypothetical protein